MERTLDWKQGLFISLGVPMLVLPSIGYFTNYMWAFSIVIWAISVLQGFFQNLAYGELASKYPEASGLPGFVQQVFSGKDKKANRFSKFLGGFSAWGYWFAWAPVVAVYSILIADYLQGLIPSLEGFSSTLLGFLIGIIVSIIMFLANWKGVSGGAKLSNILGVISLAPLLIIAIVPFFTGDFAWSNITNYMIPPDWTWDSTHFLIFFGLLSMAEWSACGWETAAVYAPEYKKPKSDIPKALFSCGFICLVCYVLVQTACVGTLGVEGVISQPLSPMLGVAEVSLGRIGAYIVIPMLIAAMLLIIQTGFLGTAKALESLSKEGNLPPIFQKTNKHGVPVGAMVADTIFTIFLISLGNPATIIAAGALGYVVANGMSLFAYVKSKKDDSLENLKNEEVFWAPKGWKFVALIWGLLNIPVYFIGTIYITVSEYGWQTAMIGVVILALYIPLWFYSKKSFITEEVTVTLSDKK